MCLQETKKYKLALKDKFLLNQPRLPMPKNKPTITTFVQHSRFSQIRAEKSSYARCYNFLVSGRLHRQKATKSRWMNITLLTVIAYLPFRLNATINHLN